MTGEIPYRIWYPLREACQLRGCERDYIYGRVRDGRKPHPGTDAIHPDQVRDMGNKLTIHRSWIYGEPFPIATPTPLPAPGMGRQEIRRAVIEAFMEIGERLAEYEANPVRIPGRKVG